MKAKDIMTTADLCFCKDTDDCSQAAQIMCQRNVGSLPVLDAQSRLVGIVTDRDLCCRVLAQGETGDLPIQQVMSVDVHFVLPETNLSEAEQLMKRYKIRRLPVVDNQRRLQGYIAQADLLRHVENRNQEHEIIEMLEVISAP